MIKAQARAGDSQNFVVGVGAEAELVDRGLEEGVRAIGISQCARTARESICALHMYSLLWRARCRSRAGSYGKSWPYLYVHLDIL